jgi:hypothetical protein
VSPSSGRTTPSLRRYSTKDGGRRGMIMDLIVQFLFFRAEAVACTAAAARIEDMIAKGIDCTRKRIGTQEATREQNIGLTNRTLD